MNKKIVIIGNWKMNKTIAEAKSFAQEFDSFAAECNEKGIKVGVSPTFLSLQTVKENSKNIIVCAQNCHFEDHGAFTGEISIAMLKEIGINHVLIGHSERRAYNNETNETCNMKIKALVANGLVPDYCVGETLTQYEAGETKNVVKEQLVVGLKDVSGEDVSKMIFAYEPVWAIGTGKNATSAIAQDICAFIRTTISQLYGENVAKEIVVQYGGSVKPENAKEYLGCNDINGVLVGGASLKVDSFKTLVSSILTK